MKILYVHDFCFYKKNEAVFTAVGLPENYFDRFFNIGVSNVSILSRSDYSDEVTIRKSGFTKVKKSSIDIPVDIRNYLSLINPLVIKNTLNLIKKSDFLVINFPSIIGLFVFILNLWVGKRYIVEVAADEDQFSNKKGGFLVTLAIKMAFPKIVRESLGSIYVSSFLENKFPCKNSAVASNVRINKVYSDKNRNIKNRSKVNILFAGGVNLRKGVDILLFAMADLIEAGYNQFHLNIAGGHFDRDYKKLVNEIGLSENVTFLGILERSELNDVYKRSDLYIQPSRAEGIPRATIEAMSYGIPVIATNLPGFKEILPSVCLINSFESVDLKNKIIEVINDDSLYEFLVEANLHCAEKFLSSNLDKIRNNFYNKVLINDYERI